MPANTITEWEQLLRSDRPMDILEALAFFGLQNDRTTTSTIMAKRPSVRHVIADLTKSTNQWISDVAPMISEQTEGWSGRADGHLPSVGGLVAE